MDTAACSLQRTELRPRKAAQPPHGQPAAESGSAPVSTSAPCGPPSTAIQLRDPRLPGRNREDMFCILTLALSLSLGFSLSTVFLKAFMAGLSWREKRFFPALDRCSICPAVWVDRADLCRARVFISLLGAWAGLAVQKGRGRRFGLPGARLEVGALRWEREASKSREPLETIDETSPTHHFHRCKN